ncbi:MAG TPA: toxin-antitoxin system YwqK family antitoxin [Vicingus sp.]|nr:toxin-antitoxin system YwqK family antitoxin [Vicingus sp.]
MRYNLIILNLLVITLFYSCKDVRKRYYADGSLETEQEYKDGIQHGMSKFYYPSGNLQEEVNYVKGKPEGLFKEYYENGQLKQEVNLVNGIQQGLLTAYYENGVLETKQNYVDGKINGAYEIYHPNGELWETAIKNNDVKLFSIIYDSLGNWVEEYRECEIVVTPELGEIELGQEIVIEFKVAGTFMETDSMMVNFGVSYEDGEEQYPSIHYAKDMNNPVYRFTPKKAGLWKFAGGLFLTRKGEGKNMTTDGRGVVWEKYPLFYNYVVVDSKTTAME